MDSLSVIKNYVEKVIEVTPKNQQQLSYLDAEILNRKITNLLLNRYVSTDNNLDTVSYDVRNDTIVLDSIFDLFEQYIKLDIYKLTGITYTEFKKMSSTEKKVFMEYVDYKVSLINLETDDVSNQLDQESQQHNLLYQT